MPVEFIIQFMVVVERLIRSKDFCRSRPHILNRHIGGEDIVQFLDDQLLSERKGGSLTDILRRSADLHLVLEIFTETSIRPGNESLLSVRSEYSNRV